jgi:hypothetical protein
MRTLKQIKRILTGLNGRLHREYKVKEIGIFGSCANGTPHKKSDIDILVEFLPGHKNFDNYMGLKFYLEKTLDAKIDLVLKNAVKEEIKENILSEVVYV